MIKPEDIEYEHYIRRSYIAGSQDCYGLLRDFYRENFEIELTDIARPEGWWLEDNLDLFGENYAREGFERVEITVRDMVVGDVLLFAIRSRFANHCAVYVGDGKIIHHMLNQLAKAETLPSWARNSCLGIFRHKDVQFEKIKREKFNLEETLNDHWRQRLNLHATARDDGGDPEGMPPAG